eukprot:c18508_g1_i1 orf=652-1431(+)
MDDMKLLQKHQSHFKSKHSEPGVTFRQNYLSRLLPELIDIHEQGTVLTLYDRLRRVKFAADMSLALTVGRVTWSEALCRNLCRQLRKQDGHGKLHSRHDDDDTLKKKAVSNSSSKQLHTHFDPGGTETTSILSAGMRSRNRVASFQSRYYRYSHLRLRNFKVRNKHVNIMNRAPLKKQNIRLRACTIARRRSCCAGGAAYYRSRTISSRKIQQIRTLGMLIPGGEGMDPNQLLEEAASYIVSLQMQVEALQMLTGSLQT